MDVKDPWALGSGDYLGEVTLRRAAEVVPFLDALVEALAGLGYSCHDCAGTRLALEEAVVNGLRHGNGGDPARRVCVRYHVRPDALLAEVEDEGPGFDPSRVPDPTLPENLGRPCGRGLLLMRHYMTWVRFSKHGNRVTLCKHRSA
jgi:serine/threonine-protein kinase RsbW